MLINVQEEYKEAIMQYRLEHLDEAVICGSGDLQNYEHYEDWKKWIDCHEQKQTLPEGRFSSYAEVSAPHDHIFL